MNRIVTDKLFLALEKGAEKYVFICDDTNEDRGNLLRLLGVFASRPDLAFSWYDAAVVSQRLRQGAAQ